MSFGAYFAMYAFRKPFTVASYADAAPVVDQIQDRIGDRAGVRLCAFQGGRDQSDLRNAGASPGRRDSGSDPGSAELALAAFAVVPPPWKVACLFANGLALGDDLGSGVRISGKAGACPRFLVAMLCASFIVSSGAVKSVGESVMLHGLGERILDAGGDGTLFVPLLLVCVFGLATMPPPTAEDERLRVARAPMDGAARRAMFAAFAPG